MQKRHFMRFFVLVVFLFVLHSSGIMAQNENPPAALPAKYEELTAPDFVRVLVLTKGSEQLAKKIRAVKTGIKALELQNWFLDDAEKLLKNKH